MAESVSLITPIGTVKFDNTRSPDKYFDGFTITMQFKPGDEGLDNFTTQLTDYQYNALGPDAEIKHPLLRPVEDGLFTLKAKTKYPVALVDHNDDPIEDDSDLRGRRARIQIDVKSYTANFGDGPVRGLTAYLKGVQVVSAAEPDTDSSSSDLPKTTAAFGKIPKEVVASDELPF